MTNKYTLVTNTEENKQKIHVEDHWKTHAEDINFGNWNVLGNWILKSNCEILNEIEKQIKIKCFYSD